MDPNIPSPEPTPSSPEDNVVHVDFKDGEVLGSTEELADQKRAAVKRHPSAHQPPEASVIPVDFQPPPTE